MKFSKHTGHAVNSVKVFTSADGEKVDCIVVMFLDNGDSEVISTGTIWQRQAVEVEAE